jgi:hypothetical protein
MQFVSSGAALDPRHIAYFFAVNYLILIESMNLDRFLSSIEPRVPIYVRFSLHHQLDLPPALKIDESMGRSMDWQLRWLHPLHVFAAFFLLSAMMLLASPYFIELPARRDALLQVLGVLTFLHFLLAYPRTRALIQSRARKWKSSNN